MGTFQSLLDEELRRKYTGKRGISKWVAFYGNPDIDRKLNIMIDKIESIVGDLPIEQLLVHRLKCPTCEESLPKFRLINNALSNRLPHYRGNILELNEKVVVDGRQTHTTGKKIYKKYENDAKGVPFVIQNAKVSRGEDGYYLEPLYDYFVVFVGKIDPFRFLATTFNIKNEWMESSL